VQPQQGRQPWQADANLITQAHLGIHELDWSSGRTDGFEGLAPDDALFVSSATHQNNKQRPLIHRSNAVLRPNIGPILRNLQK